MTKEQMRTELLYHASISPFKTMLDDGVISKAEYRAIYTILRGKYSPLFVGESYQISLDNEPELR